jgi:FkbM family methyltransferase
MQGGVVSTTFDATESAPQAGNQRLGRGFSLPIVLGPLRGCWWQPTSGGKITRLLLGTYEREQSQAFEQRIRPGEQLLDIGAAVGYYSLLAAQLVGRHGRVFAFEPDATNLEYLRRHCAQNRLAQITVLGLALDDVSGTARFGGGTGTGTGRLCQEGGQTVAVRRLDDVAAEHQLAPQHIKIDVEGAELGVLRGGEQLIRTCRPTLYLSTHDWIRAGVHHACCELLSDWGYQLQPLLGDSIAATSELLCTIAR